MLRRNRRAFRTAGHAFFPPIPRRCTERAVPPARHARCDWSERENFTKKLYAFSSPESIGMIGRLRNSRFVNRFGNCGNCCKHQSLPLNYSRPEPLASARRPPSRAASVPFDAAGHDPPSDMHRRWRGIANIADSELQCDHDAPDVEYLVRYDSRPTILRRSFSAGSSVRITAGPYRRRQLAKGQPRPVGTTGCRTRRDSVSWISCRDGGRF